jgi:hypothetical protein
MRLLIRTVFASLDENTHEASGHRSANIGFRVVPNHRDIFDSAPQAFDGEFEERRRGLSQHGGFSTGSVFQRRDERACVETEFAIVIEEVAVFGQGEKLGPLKNLAISSVQQIVSEEFARIPDVRIPTQAGRGYRFEAGQGSDLMPATVPR